MRNYIFIYLSLLFYSLSGFAANIQENHITRIENEVNQTETAIFASGCFWCIEAKFSQLKGVLKVTSGYTGGHIVNPSYEQVSTGTTGHAEACTIVYDPAIISYDELLEAFFVSHDPTQLNRQGNDIGTQYRSAIYYNSEIQRQKAAYYVDQLTKQKIYNNLIVTEIKPFTTFYKAESYHQEYYKKNPNQSYCRYVVQPQLEKFKKIFKDKLK